MLGKTNSNIQKEAGGATLTAVNKTGAAISQGDKVWINNGSQVAGSQVAVYSGNQDSSRGPVLNTTGTVAWAKGDFYSVTAESAVEIGESTLLNALQVIYDNTNRIFGNSTRIDGGSQYMINGELIINSNYNTTASGTIEKRNYDTGELIKTYTNAAASSQNIINANEHVVFNGIVYRLNSQADYKYVLDEDASTYRRSSYTFDNAFVYSTYPLGVTTDQKYAIAAAGSASTFAAACNLRLIEYIEDGHLKTLSQSEMPDDLQPYYSAKKGIITFNPSTGILAIVTSPTDYIVMQYKNGVWNKLSIDLGYPEDATTDRQTAGVTFSSDMSRCAIGYSTSSSNYVGKVVNLTNITGKVAVPYKPYNISADTVTGYAKASASVDGSFKACVANGE